MDYPIPINIVVEDDLSEIIVRTILKSTNIRYTVSACLGKRGYVYIKDKILAFNSACKGMPYIVITDLESICPPSQIKEWLSVPIHRNLLFRIAVKEIEAWVMADRLNFALFLGIRQELIPQNVDSIENPKQFLVNLARQTRKKLLRESIVPKQGSTARVGPDYNGTLSEFVWGYWNLEEAIKHSDSLRRAFYAINNFQPSW